jgi:hypothetical protein
MEDSKTHWEFRIFTRKKIN